ncbi:hypothetical protein BD626DRAFT_491711 [Schizophyllum amplum]|uniref:DUF427 domain-containing protein n=1 Tax=Schizophyllum amplum TaxID=97359 RepID=A0A550CI54_9AGAR|nr:hypothetical protein BD626DRAFT_491711 [Auriculariopsis ampla]
MQTMIHHMEDCPKRVRVVFQGIYIIDTRKAKLVWEKPQYPTYFFPNNELPSWYLDNLRLIPEGAVYDLAAGAKRAVGGVTKYTNPTSPIEGFFKLDFPAMDAWFEEDEEIFVHPKDPYKRIDILQSSRHVRVEINCQVIAETRAPRMLYETTLPPRTYIPRTDCQAEMLIPSEKSTGCPYKGRANYYSVQLLTGEIVPDVAWSYRYPTQESTSIRGYICFYDEKVDLFVDGEKQVRPITHFS